jgi:hypothetical protein
MNGCVRGDGTVRLMPVFGHLPQLAARPDGSASPNVGINYNLPKKLVRNLIVLRFYLTSIRDLSGGNNNLLSKSGRGSV